MTVKSKIERAVSDAEAQGMEAVKAVSEVRDNMANAIDKSLERRPYTTLLLAVGVGFLLGAVWAR
jgi:ElaB/YqjD/DUF883 family membrane-anchored ribosome-binding protein